MYLYTADISNKQVRVASVSLPRPRDERPGIRGACRMGRLARLVGVEEPAFALQHCETDAAGANCTTMRADGTRNITRFTVLPPHAPTRALANQTTRSRKCGNCDAHHETKFVNRDGSETPLGAATGQ